MQIEIEKDETFLVSVECKLNWFGYGEWVEEADKVSFQYKGYECLIHRVFAPEHMRQDCVFGGHLCGYVRIPENHCYYQKDIKKMLLMCHGGLSYNSTNESGAGDHWTGFDCAHMSDYVPQLTQHEKTFPYAHVKRILEEYPNIKPIYKNMDFCTKQCTSIVDQLIEIQNEHNNKENS